MDDAWERVFAKMTYGVYVLTSCYEDVVNGMIASWASRVSYDPPLIMTAVHPDRYTHALVRRSGCFALHVISRGQKYYFKRFKGPDPAAKFDSLDWRRGKTGCPILEDCIGFLECEVKAEYAPGNHALFIGEVVDGDLFSPGDSITTQDYDGIYTGKH